jgi:hypothetical protein
MRAVRAAARPTLQLKYIARMKSRSQRHKPPYAYPKRLNQIYVEFI